MLRHAALRPIAETLERRNLSPDCQLAMTLVTFSALLADAVAVLVARGAEEAEMIGQVTNALLRRFGYELVPVRRN
jgi:hypothetical protein